MIFLVYWFLVRVYYWKIVGFVIEKKSNGVEFCGLIIRYEEEGIMNV